MDWFLCDNDLRHERVKLIIWVKTKLLKRLALEKHVKLI